jgi:hypothetical protein
MKIALDWDGTVTRDIEFWATFVELCKLKNVDVRIVTMRHEREIDDAMREFNIPIICTARMQKRTHCRDIEWFADIWIDDAPEFIVDLDFRLFVDKVKEE